MIAIAAKKLFMRLKFAKNAFLNFDHMIALAANKLFVRLKFANNAVLGFDHIIKVLTSWSKLSNIIDQIWSHEKVEFWPTKTTKYVKNEML